MQKDQGSTCFSKHHCLEPKDMQDAAEPKFGLQEPKHTYQPLRAGQANYIGHQLPGLPGCFEAYPDYSPGSIRDRCLAQIQRKQPTQALASKIQVLGCTWEVAETARS